MNREVAHLTYHRASFKEGGPGWSIYLIYTELAQVMERFTQRVEQSRVCDGFREGVTVALPRVQPKPDEPHRPGGYSVGPSVPTQGLRPS